MTYSLSLSQAAGDLDWCAAIPHTLDQVLGIYSEELNRNGRGSGRKMSNAEILSSLVNHAGGGGKGGHSDPTPRAALSGEPDDADETVGRIDAVIDGMHEAVGELHRLAGAAYSGIAVTRTDRVKRIVSGIHRVIGQLEDNHLVSEMAHDLASDAQWLRSKAEGIWLASKGETYQVAEQKPIAECTVCAGWRTGSLAVAAGRCEPCDYFHRNHGVDRTEGIVRRAEYGKGPTPAQMIEARAKKPARKRRTATA